MDSWKHIVRFSCFIKRSKLTGVWQNFTTLRISHKMTTRRTKRKRRQPEGSVSEFKQKYACNIFIQRKKNLVKYIKSSTYSVTKENFSIVNKSKKKKKLKLSCLKQETHRYFKMSTFSSSHFFSNLSFFSFLCQFKVLKLLLI